MVGFVLYTRGVKVLEETKLDLQTRFLVVQEMLGRWPHIVSYNDSTGQQQEYQLVHGRVSSWSLIVWYEAKYFLFIVLLQNLTLGTSV